MGTKLSKSNKGGKVEEFIVNEKTLPDNFGQTSTLPASFRKKGQTVNRSEWTGSLPRNSGKSKGPPKQLDRSASFSKRFRKSCRNWAKQKGLVTGNKPADENEATGKPDVMTEKVEDKPVEVQDVPEVIITEPEKEMDLAAIVATLVVEAHKKKMASRAQSRAQSREALLDDCTPEIKRNEQSMDESDKKQHEYSEQETHETLETTKVEKEVSNHESALLDTEVSEPEVQLVNDLCDNLTKQAVEGQDFSVEEVKNIDVEKTDAYENAVTEKSEDEDHITERNSCVTEIQELENQQLEEENIARETIESSSGIIIEDTKTLDANDSEEEEEDNQSLVFENSANTSEKSVMEEGVFNDSGIGGNHQIEENNVDLIGKYEENQESVAMESMDYKISEQDSAGENNTMKQIENLDIAENKKEVNESLDNDESDAEDTEETLSQDGGSEHDQSLGMKENTDHLEQKQEDEAKEENVLVVEYDSDDALPVLKEESELLTEDVVVKEVHGLEMAEQENDKEIDMLEDGIETCDTVTAGEITLSAVAVSDSGIASSEQDLDVCLTDSDHGKSDEAAGLMDEIINDIVETVTNESRDAVSDESICETPPSSLEFQGATTSEEETGKLIDRNDDVIQNELSRDSITSSSENESEEETEESDENTEIHVTGDSVNVETGSIENMNAESDEFKCESPSGSIDHQGGSSSDEETVEADDKNDDIIQKHVTRDSVTVPSENESCTEKLER